MAIRYSVTPPLLPLEASCVEWPAALALPFWMRHPFSQAPGTTETASERLAHRCAAMCSNGVAAFSITAFTLRQGVGDALTHMSPSTGSATPTRSQRD